MLQLIAETQREIHVTLSGYLSSFADERSWVTLLAVLPMGMVFGAIHALMPGHSKTVIATYLAGSPIGYLRGMLASLALSFTHVTTAVLIAILALPLVSKALGSLGQTPLLSDVSRGALALIGAWMLWRSLRRNGHHSDHEGEAVGFAAGLIPCPLTLFVMTYAMARGVPEAGLTFAAAMMIGVACTLTVVALAAVSFRRGLMALLDGRTAQFATVARFLEGSAGLLLVWIGIREVFMR